MSKIITPEIYELESFFTECVDSTLLEDNIYCFSKSLDGSKLTFTMNDDYYLSISINYENENMSLNLGREDIKKIEIRNENDQEYLFLTNLNNKQLFEGKLYLSTKIQIYWNDLCLGS